MADRARKHRWGRRLLTILVILFALAYTAGWFIFRPYIEKFADDWVQQQRATGITVEYSERRVEGFPLNFELVFDDPVMEGQDGVRWEGEQFRLESRTWDLVALLTNRWGRLKAKSPGNNVVTGSGDRLDLKVGTGSALLAAWTPTDGISEGRLKFDEVEGVLNGEQFSMNQFVLELSPSETLDAMFDLMLSWDEADFPDNRLQELRAAVEGGGVPSALRIPASNIVGALESGEQFELPLLNVLRIDESGVSSPLVGVMN